MPRSSAPSAARTADASCRRLTQGHPRPTLGQGRLTQARFARFGYDPSQMPVALKALQTAIDVMADGAIVADTRTGETFVNRAAREMLGIPDDAVVDTTYLKDTVGFYPFDLATGGDGQPIREEVRIGDRVLHSVVTPLREGTESVGAIVILRDMGDTADVARRRSEFAQVMSHELRTPLTSIAGALDIVLSG